MSVTGSPVCPARCAVRPYHIGLRILGGVGVHHADDLLYLRVGIVGDLRQFVGAGSQGGVIEDTGRGTREHLERMVLH